MPEDELLIIDASGVERLGAGLANVLPMSLLLERSAEVRWIVGIERVDELVTQGVQPSSIEVVHRAPLTTRGHPIVLGGLVISSPDMIALAMNGARLDLVRELRGEFRLTMEQASRAAKELLAIVAAG